mmetsp:Transcript_14153/g.40675  ORF Transcript_14153/g.40675 Transcript_14153/m.40675 type:complete len:426 (+) Transcript_14153:277-1554(+)
MLPRPNQSQRLTEGHPAAAPFAPAARRLPQPRRQRHGRHGLSVRHHPLVDGQQGRLVGEQVDGCVGVLLCVVGRREAEGGGWEEGGERRRGGKETDKPAVFVFASVSLLRAVRLPFSPPHCLRRRRLGKRHWHRHHTLHLPLPLQPVGSNHPPLLLSAQQTLCHHVAHGPQPPVGLTHVKRGQVERLHAILPGGGGALPHGDEGGHGGECAGCRGRRLVQKGMGDESVGVGVELVGHGVAEVHHRLHLVHFLPPVVARRRGRGGLMAVRGGRGRHDGRLDGVHRHSCAALSGVDGPVTHDDRVGVAAVDRQLQQRAHEGHAATPPCRRDVVLQTLGEEVRRAVVPLDVLDAIGRPECPRGARGVGVVGVGRVGEERGAGCGSGWFAVSCVGDDGEYVEEAVGEGVLLDEVGRAKERHQHLVRRLT